MFIFGTKKNDVRYGSDDGDLIWGWNGNDWLYGKSGNDQIFGGSGDDYLFGGSGPRSRHGSYDDGDDVIKGGDGNDHIYGENGEDILYGDDGDDENEPARLFVQKLLRTRFQNIPVSEGSMDCSSSDVPLGKQRNDILAQMVRIGSKMQHKEIKLANLVESVAAKCMGVPHVHLYLKKCFA